MNSNQNERWRTFTHRSKMFFKVYWRTMVIIVTPFILMPVAFTGENKAYKCFYLFLIYATYLLTDVLPACVTAMVPVAIITMFAYVDLGYVNQMYVRCAVVDCIGVMMLIIAIECSEVNRRIALKLLMILGISHYKLSFLLFFTTMFLSMWISNTVACGLMMPMVKAVLIELEKLGIVELRPGAVVGPSQNMQKIYQHEIDQSKPTDITIFYFLGIAFSSSVGGMATTTGSETNQIFKIYCETLFPLGPKIEFPHFMLLSLPGVLLTESIMYAWLNFYFLGMFRAHTDLALQLGMTEEETEYVAALLLTQYKELGKISFHEIIVSLFIILAFLLQVTSSTMIEEGELHTAVYGKIKIFAPCIISAILLFITPIDLDFIKFFRSDYGTTDAPLPIKPSKSCLNWNLVTENLQWSVLLIAGGGTCMFETLKESRMTDEFGKFLEMFSTWPAPILAMVTILLCKVLTEFAPNSCVVYCLLPHIAKLSVEAVIHPYYLMTAATLACALPFHLVTGTPSNALVASYLNIPTYKMMQAGIGPSIIGVVVIWFVISVWSKVIWPDIDAFPNWAHHHMPFTDTR